jgi:PAS domain S-box-containing protein
MQADVTTAETEQRTHDAEDTSRVDVDASRVVVDTAQTEVGAPPAAVVSPVARSRRRIAILERLEAALESEAKYRALVEQLPAITYTESLDTGRVISISPQVETILGYTQDEWLLDPQLCVTLIHVEDRDRVVRASELANRTKEPYRAEFRMISRDGRVVWIRDEAVLVRGMKGQPLCWQGVMLDITVHEQLSPEG